MVNKLIVSVLVMSLLLISSFSVYAYSNSNIWSNPPVGFENTPPKIISYNLEEVKTMEESYQGPVPQGYDLEHFRKTGETILEVSD